MQVLKKENKNIRVNWKGHEGVFEAKIEDKKGYCQDVLMMKG